MVFNTKTVKKISMYSQKSRQTRLLSKRCVGKMSQSFSVKKSSDPKTPKKKLFFKLQN